MKNGCVPLSMVTSNRESRNPMDCLYITHKKKKSLETVKSLGRQWVNVSSHQMNSRDCRTPYSKQALKLIQLSEVWLK